MKWSDNILIPTLKESPSEAESLSHKLMMRAGLIRKLGSGIYCYLPIGKKVLSKTIDIVRKHMNLAGAQELLLSALQPAALWENSGRLKLLGEDIFIFKDRHKNLMILGPTHEEVITDLVSKEIKSYKQLPQILYQIQTKFRDEPRPRFGVIRSKEFIMKDAYSFDADEDGLNKNYALMRKTYCNIFSSCGLDFIMVEADPGIMGGGQSAEFMVPSESGEDFIVSCNCGAAFSLAVAPCFFKDTGKKRGKQRLLKEVSTPSKMTVEEVSQFLKVSPQNLVKTIIYSIEKQGPVAVLVRGDHRINETKLKKLLGTDRFNLADGKTILELAGSKVGFSGPVNLRGVKIIADYAVKGMSNFVCGANKNDMHLTGVNEPRDFKIDKYADLRFIENGDICPKCQKSKMELKRAIEVGHIFKLGTFISEKMEAFFLNQDGISQPMVMGSYGIGLGRLLAALIEQSHDNKGIIWPLMVAPYQVHLCPLHLDNPSVATEAEKVYQSLEEKGVEVLFDDRNESPGVKFNDADLLGMPLRLTLSPRTLKSKEIELKWRTDKEAQLLPLDNLVNQINGLWREKSARQLAS